MTDGLGSKTYAYNQLSQMTSETRVINGLGSFAMGYDYNLAGELQKITDATNMTIDYGYDNIGRVNNVTGSDDLFTALANYAANLQYRAWDGLKAMSYGSGQSLSVGYTNRLQTQSWTITGSLNQGLQNPAGKQIEHQYYADGRQKYSHDLLANQFD